MKHYLLSFSLIFLHSLAQGASISFLKGDTYKTYNEQEYSKDIITIDHFGQWHYGSIFFFYDISRGVKKDDQSDFFGSISPMFSLNKITGSDFSSRWFHDVEIKLELEHVSGFTPVYFYGFNFPLKVPRFRNFSVAPVVRDAPNKRGVGGQLLIAWGLPLSLPMYFTSKLDILFTGFLAAGLIPEDQDEFFMVSQPQLLLDIGKPFKFEKDQLYSGIEYSYSINRFLKKGTPKPEGGVEPGFNESVVQAMVKLNY